MTLKSVVIQQSGVIPYRLLEGKVEVLLITSSRHKRWIIPKGFVEPWMTSADSAAKEAREEAGVIGHITTPAIGFYKARKWGFVSRVEVFLMQVETVLEAWDEAHIRDRQWMSVAKAAKRINIPELKLILQSIDQYIKTGC